MIEIRAEQPLDISGVGQVTFDAFSQSELGHHGEADLVSAIRAAQPDAISLVALDAGKIIGHLMSSPATVESQGRIISGTAIGPVSVVPSHQHQGIGCALMNTLIEIASVQGYNFVAVAGHPDFYLRFGFHPLNLPRVGSNHRHTD